MLLPVHPRPFGTGAVPRWLEAAAGLVLVLGILAGALHRHAPDESPQHPCVICSLHHAPATPTMVATPEPPAPTFERVAPIKPAAPRAVATESAPTRAPPTA